MRIRPLCIAALSLLLPAVAYAGPSAPALPEPETLALLGVGAIALVVARWRKK